MLCSVGVDGEWTHERIRQSKVLEENVRGVVPDTEVKMNNLLELSGVQPNAGSLAVTTGK
jgi:hypothetical protein